MYTSMFQKEDLLLNQLFFDEVITGYFSTTRIKFIYDVN
jgi:hypothetical protein